MPYMSGESMMYDIVKQTTWREKEGKSNQFHIVSEKERDNFGEHIADTCGYQDYSYTEDFKDVATDLSEQDLLCIMNGIKRELKLDVDNSNPEEPWLNDGKCKKPKGVICNLGYACDACPWNNVKA